MKMHQGHHGANHPVKDLTTGKVEITSMNHGFAVDRDTLPANAVETHVSLFDGSNCGIALKDKPVFSVQYHPEASPGPRDSRYLFERFVGTDAGEEAGSSARCFAQTPLSSPRSTRDKLRASCLQEQRKSARCRLRLRLEAWPARRMLRTPRAERADLPPCFETRASVGNGRLMGAPQHEVGVVRTNRESTTTPFEDDRHSSRGRNHDRAADAAHARRRAGAESRGAGSQHELLVGPAVRRPGSRSAAAHCRTGVLRVGLDQRSRLLDAGLRLQCRPP